jgi:3-oxoadipate enol-lactonase
MWTPVFLATHKNGLADMALIHLDDIRLNAQISGPPDGAPLVLIHALGTNLTLWDGLMPHLAGHRVLRLDLRGHGGSDVARAPYSMGGMIRDVERVMEHFSMRDAVGVGVSLGGLILQGLAVKRLDLIRGMVLSNTAARIGGPALWQTRVAEVRASGLTAYASGALQRILGRQWQDHPARARVEQMLLSTNPEGWIGAAMAISGADFYTTTAALRLPALVIAGGRDATTPPDMVRETADLILGHRWHLFANLGHLPMIEDPGGFGAVLTDFLGAVGHG